MQARLWCTNSLETKATLDEHSQAITDIRFSPSMRRLATSSQDKTLKIWDLENVLSIFYPFPFYRGGRMVGNCSEQG